MSSQLMTEESVEAFELLLKRVRTRKYFMLIQEHYVESLVLMKR
jgi:hypothetical protein